MFFFKNYIDSNGIPDELYDKNIIANYGKINTLIRLQNNDFYIEMLSDILDNNEIMAILNTEFNLEKKRFDRDDIISLLYYFGYLTIKESDKNVITFTIPNKMMKENYDGYFRELIRESINIDRETIKESAYEIINERKITKITSYIESILKSKNSREFINFDHKYIQEMYKLLFNGVYDFNIELEYQCSGG